MGTTNANAINYFSPAKYVVSKVAGEGTHTTIASAISSASSGDTIVIMPASAYSENLTLSAGINLVAYQSDSSLNNTGNVQITGKCTFTGAGTVTISGIQLNTNSDYLLAVTGSAASIVNLNNCYLNFSNNTGIDYTSSSGSSAINITNCTGNVGTTSIGIYTSSGAGTIYFQYCYITNTGSTTTASSNSAGVVDFYATQIYSPISCSSTGIISGTQSLVGCDGINTTAITTAGTGSSSWVLGYAGAGTATAISVGSGTTLDVYNSLISSSNAHCISGAGTIQYMGNTYTSLTGVTQNVTTRTPLTFEGGFYKGLYTNTAPEPGCIGEYISSTQSSGTSLSNTVQKNLTSINLTPGVWDVSCGMQVNFSSTNTGIIGGISASTGSLTGNAGDQYVSQGISGSGNNISLGIAAFRVLLSMTTTYYLVAQANFSAGSATGYGRISGTRVA